MARAWTDLSLVYMKKRTTRFSLHTTHPGLASPVCIFPGGTFISVNGREGFLTCEEVLRIRHRK